MIEIKKLSKSFGSKQVLFDIDMTFRQGRVYGIVGRNGAGKSTLFRCMSGLEIFDGTINTPYENLKNHLGLLITNPVFMSRITGWEYLKLLCTARGEPFDDFESKNIFDLPLEEYAEHYSTGMKKKLALLGVLLQKNDVFILDEPFSGVDIQSNMIIVEIIDQLRKQGKTILISSHIFGTLSQICDEIYLLDEGRLEQSYAPDQFDALEMGMKKRVVSDKIGMFDF